MVMRPGKFSRNSKWRAIEGGGGGGGEGKLSCDFSNSVMTLLECRLARVTKLPISVALVYIRNRRSPSVKLVGAS